MAIRKLTEDIGLASENSYYFEKENFENPLCNKTEKVSNDILDLLPSDPFGMDISVLEITGWKEDFDEDFGLKILGLGTNESEVKEEDDQLLAGLNSDSNRIFGVVEEYLEEKIENHSPYSYIHDRLCSRFHQKYSNDTIQTNGDLCIMMSDASDIGYWHWLYGKDHRKEYKKDNTEKITGWKEDFDEDFGLKILGFGTDEAEVKEEDDQLLARLNSDSNGIFGMDEEYLEDKYWESWVAMKQQHQSSNTVDGDSDRDCPPLIDALADAPDLNINVVEEHTYWKSWVATKKYQRCNTMSDDGDQGYPDSVIHSVAHVLDLSKDELPNFFGFALDESEVKKGNDQLFGELTSAYGDVDQGYPDYVIDIIADVLDLTEDEVPKFFGLGADKLEVKKEDDPLYTKVNWALNRGMGSYPEKTIVSAMYEEFWSGTCWDSDKYGELVAATNQLLDCKTIRGNLEKLAVDPDCCFDDWEKGKTDKLSDYGNNHILE